MRVYSFSARYARYIDSLLEVVLEKAKRDCEADAAMREADPDTPYPFIPAYAIDFNRTGDSYIVVEAPIDVVLEDLTFDAGLTPEALRADEQKKRKDAA